jgi:hypothetical protein
VEISLFEAVADALRGMVPADLGEMHHREHRYGVKVWFGDAAPAREHDEAQVIRADGVEGARRFALEVGFHAEHAARAANEEVIARLRRAERRWRRRLGTDAVVGPFIGRPDVWRRVSETWPDPDLGAPGVELDIATRLAAYVAAIEPLRRTG